MSDVFSREMRSWIMARVRSRNTAPELRVRSLLHRMGYRFTVNGPRNRSLPGRPDLVMPRFRTCFFVHGCFWHQHPGCRKAKIPASNVEYWQRKLARNGFRDERNFAELRKLQWRVVVIWECELSDLCKVAERVAGALNTDEWNEGTAAAENPCLYYSRNVRSAYGDRQETRKLNEDDLC